MAAEWATLPTSVMQGDPDEATAKRSARVANERAVRGSKGAGGNLKKLTRSHHAPTRMNAAPLPLLDDQFMENFFYWALGRYSNPTEATYWKDIHRSAYANGQGSIVLTERELGKTLFESTEYALRGRNDHWFVYDLYKTYLMRDPDPGGWS